MKMYRACSIGYVVYHPRVTCVSLLIFSEPKIILASPGTSRDVKMISSSECKSQITYGIGAVVSDGLKLDLSSDSAAVQFRQ